MLTPDKIREKQFQSSGRGSYRADDVDAFMNEVSASYEQMFKENGDLIRKISILAKKVEEYRADEESLKLALLNAQKLADQIVSEAKEKAEKETAEATAAAEKKLAETEAQAQELSANSKRESAAIIESARAQAERIVAEANKKSDEIIGNINRKVTHETLVFDMIKKEASDFKLKLAAMYKEHINLINQLPEIVDEQLDSEKAEEDKKEDVAEAATANAEAEPTSAAEPVKQSAEPAEEPVPVAEKPSVEEEASAPEEEPAFEDVYSDSAEKTDDVSYDSVPEEPVKDSNPFKLDLSKIDFSDDDDDDEEDEEAVAESAVSSPAFENLEAEDSSDDDDDASGSISFKNFFKKK